MLWALVCGASTTFFGGSDLGDSIAEEALGGTSLGTLETPGAGVAERERASAFEVGGFALEPIPGAGGSGGLSARVARGGLLERRGVWRPDDT